MTVLFCRCMFLRRVSLDALNRYNQRLRARERKQAKAVYDTLSNTTILQITLDDDKSTRMYLGVGAAELCPILVRGLNDPVLLRCARGVNVKLVALFVANWIVNIPFVRETIATPETLMLSLNMLMKVSNVCVILTNLYLLLVEDEVDRQNVDEGEDGHNREEDVMEEEGDQDEIMEDSLVYVEERNGSDDDHRRATTVYDKTCGDDVEYTLQLLDVGLQYNMYEWDETFLSRMFVSQEERNRTGKGIVINERRGWGTSYLWAAFLKKCLKDRRRNGAESESLTEREKEADVVMKIVCEDIVKILLYKMMGRGKNNMYEREVQTAENNAVLRRIGKFCPGLVDVLVDKHMNVLNGWFQEHLKKSAGPTLMLKLLRKLSPTPFTRPMALKSPRFASLILSAHAKPANTEWLSPALFNQR